MVDEVPVVGVPVFSDTVVVGEEDTALLIKPMATHPPAKINARQTISTNHLNAKADLDGRRY